MRDDLTPYLRDDDVADRPAPLQRADVYRRLVRDNLRSVVDNAFPITRGILGDRFERELFAPFLAAGGPSTSFYREIPGDLVRWAAAAEHPFTDLLHYEWLELQAARHPADLDALSDGDGHVRPNPTLQLGVYSRPVHTMCADAPDPLPFDAPHAYLVWRRPRTDAIAFQRVGLIIARAVELAAVAEANATPLTREALAAALATEAQLEVSVIQLPLGAALDALRARDGVRD